MARSGGTVAERTIEVQPRDVRRRIEVTGRGSINSTHTSDLWPWTGKDGRDYALVGTWGGDGYAFGYDITDGHKAVEAFQRRWRPRRIDGEIDGEIRAILFQLLLDRDEGRTR